MNINNQNSKIKKAIFLMGGYGTRFLPASKTIPKQMLPIGNKPLLQYLVEEAVDAGIEEVIFVTGKGKSAIDDHFDRDWEIEEMLEKKGKLTLLYEFKKIHNMAKFATIRQNIANGDGGAMMLTSSFIGESESVLMIFPDYYMPSQNNTMKKMLEFYHETGKAVIAADIVPMEKVSSFGVIDYEKAANVGGGEFVKIKRFVEKPKTQDAPSNLISIGFAVITPEIFNSIKTASSTVDDGEIRVADAFTQIIDEGGEIYALKPEIPGFDCGNALGLIKANLFVGLENPLYKQDLLNFIEEITVPSRAKFTV